MDMKAAAEYAAAPQKALSRPFIWYRALPEYKKTMFSANTRPGVRRFPQAFLPLRRICFFSLP